MVLLTYFMQSTASIVHSLLIFVAKPLFLLRMWFSRFTIDIRIPTYFSFEDIFVQTIAVIVHLLLILAKKKPHFRFKIYILDSYFFKTFELLKNSKQLCS